MLRSKWFWILVVAAVTVGIIVYRRSGGDAPVAPHTVDRGTVIETVSVSGTLEPVTSVDLSFEAIGTVAWVGVAVGDRVTAGQTLVRLDRAALATQYAAVQQQVYITEQEEKMQRRKWDHLKPEQREQYKARSQQARDERAQVGVALAKTVLTAPIDGIVTLQEAQAGERVKEVGTIIRIIADDAFEVETLVPEADIARFAVGTSGRAAFDALGADHPVDVTVDRIEPEATTVQDVVYYKVYFRAPQLTRAGGMPDGLRAGMSADVDLVMAERADVVRLPRRLVGQDGQGFFVTVLTDPARPEGERRSITLGIQGDDGMVEVVSGLSAGDHAIPLPAKE